MNEIPAEVVMSAQAALDAVFAHPGYDLVAVADTVPVPGVEGASRPSLGVYLCRSVPAWCAILEDFTFLAGALLPMDWTTPDHIRPLGTAVEEVAFRVTRLGIITEQDVEQFVDDASGRGLEEQVFDVLLDTVGEGYPVLFHPFDVRAAEEVPVLVAAFRDREVAISQGLESRAPLPWEESLTPPWLYGPMVALRREIEEWESTGEVTFPVLTEEGIGASWVELVRSRSYPA